MTGNRWFESISLQRGVSNEPGPSGGFRRTPFLMRRLVQAWRATLFRGHASPGGFDSTWDREFESTLLQRRVSCEPYFLSRASLMAAVAIYRRAAWFLAV
jgi:hypothetical protein